jgi:DNA-directed RNA polymerase subunit RPC12/RpoP
LWQGEKAYSCAQCNTRFTYRNGLIKHTKLNRCPKKILTAEGETILKKRTRMIVKDPLAQVYDDSAFLVKKSTERNVAHRFALFLLPTSHFIYKCCGAEAALFSCQEPEPHKIVGILEFCNLKGKGSEPLHFSIREPEPELYQIDMASIYHNKTII